MDLRNLGNIQLDRSLSLFDPISIEKAQRRDFLRHLVEQLTQPVMPETQDRDYLPTQVIADYLATHRGGPIDGIIYASVQTPQRSATCWVQKELADSEDTPGFNVALFPRASRVKNAEGKQTARASLWEWDDDGPGRHLAPEIVPIPESAHRNPSDYPPFSGPKPRWPVTLEIALASIKVHEVAGVCITTIDRGVAVRKPTA